MLRQRPISGAISKSPFASAFENNTRNSCRNSVDSVQIFSLKIYNLAESYFWINNSTIKVSNLQLNFIGFLKYPSLTDKKNFDPLKNK